VSCSDLENELAQVEGTANDNAAAIESLNSELAALKTALSAAQADADAAMAAAKAAKEAGDAAKAEAEAAKAAAEQAKAEAIAAVMAEVEAIQTAIAQNVEAITNLSGSVNANAVEIEALQEEIKALQTAAAEHVYAITNLNGSIENHEMAIEDLETELSVLQNTLANYEKNLKDLGLLTDEFKEDIAQLTYAVTNLTTAVETNTNDIDGLKEQFEDVVAQVKTLNDSLIAIYDILGVLANQIQSVTYVPEYKVNGVDVVYANCYTARNLSGLNHVATATYEVRPAKLAAGLTSENLSFVSVDTKTTGAAAPEYFKAKLVSADATTGRIVVSALINHNEPADSRQLSDYEILTDNDDATGLALALNIASIDVTELLIAESNPANVEMVSSEYVAVEAKDADLEIGFKVLDEDGDYVVGNYNEVFEMPYNTPVANSKVNLFEEAVPVVRLSTDNAEEFLTLEEANELLGTQLATKIVQANTTYFANDEDGNSEEITSSKDKAPIKVADEKTFAATAELQASEDYKDEAAVGAYTVTRLNVQFVNGAAQNNVVRMWAAATYKITNKKSDFSFADAEEVAWSYAAGDYAKAIEQELAVVGFDKMKKGDSWTFVAEVDDEEYEATVEALSSKAVQVNIADGELPYKQGEKAVYEFKGTVTYDNVDYAVAFNVTLGAMPADQVIDLGEIQIAGNTNNSTTKNVEAFFKAREVINAADAKFNEYYSTENDDVFATTADVANALTGLVMPCNTDAAENDGVLYNGKLVTSGEGYARLNLAAGVDEDDDEVLVDASTIRVNYVEVYENTIELTKTYTICGVDFTFKATIKTVKPEYKFEINNVTAPNGVATVTGQLDKALAVTSSATAASTGELSALLLEQIDLAKLVTVDVTEGTENDFLLKYELTNLYDADGKLIKVGNHQLEESDLAGRWKEYTDINGNTYDWYGTDNKLIWEGLDVAELVFDITLCSRWSNDADIDGTWEVTELKTVSVKVQMPQLVKLTVAPVATKYVQSAVNTVNVVKGLSVKDKFGNNVYNTYANTVDELFHGYNLTIASGVATGTVKNDNFFNLKDNAYDMEVKLAEEKDVVIKHNDVVISHNALDFTYDNVTGQITINEDDFKVEGVLKFEVPVEFTYRYDNYGALKQTETVVVSFSPEGTAVGGGMTYDTPDGKQWVADGFGPAGPATVVYDFGTAKVTNLLTTDVTKVYAMGWLQETAIPDMLEANTWYTMDVCNYTITATNSTSGTITLNSVYPNSDYTKLEVDTQWPTTFKYSNYTGTTLTLQYYDADTDQLGEPIECELNTTKVDSFIYFYQFGGGPAGDDDNFAL